MRVRWSVVAGLVLALAGCDRRPVAGANGNLIAWPGRLDFSRVAMYAGADQEILLRNIGRGPLVVQDVWVENSDGTTYQTEWTHEGEHHLKPGDTCTLRVKFRPVKEGAHPAVLVIRPDTPDQEALRLPLEGVGVNAKAEVDVRELDFGRIEAQARKVLTLTYRNISDLTIEVATHSVGTDADEFTIPGFSMAPFEVRVMEATFAPQRVGVKQAGFELEPCRNCPREPIRIKAEALDRAVVAEPWELDFGQVPIDRDAHLMARLHNISTEPQQVTAKRLSQDTDASFTSPEAPFPVTLAPDQILEWDVRYSPGHMGVADGMLEFDVVSVRNPKTLIPLRGFGGAAELCVSPGSHDFGTLPVGAKLARLVNVKNCGSPNDAPLTIHRISFGGDGISGEGMYGFEAPPTPITLRAGEEFNVKVFYEPTAEGTHAGYLHLRTSAFSAAHVRVGFTGRAEGAALCKLVVTPSEVDFGTVQPDRGAVLGVRVRNDGSELCAVKNIKLNDSAGGIFGMPGGVIDGLLMWPGNSFSFMVSVRTPASGGRFTGELQIESADPANPRFRVPLRVNSERSCLIATPPFLDFGVVRSDCPPDTMQVTLFNQCADPVTLNEVFIGSGTADGEFAIDRTSPRTPITLAGGEEVKVDVRYFAQVKGMNLSPLYADATGIAEPFLVPLIGEMSDNTEKTDRFVQQDGSKVDVLFVVDNTASMVEEHPKLERAMPAFANAALSNQVDLNVAVTTTGISAVSADCPGGAMGGEAGRLFPADGSNVRLMTEATPALGSELQQNVAVGQCANVEQGFEAMRRALTDPLISSADDPRTPLPNDGNLGFLRESAALVVVFVGDEDDHSPDSVDTYVQFLRARKGANQPQRAVIYAIAPTGAVCASAGGSGTRYAEAARATGGDVMDICAADYAPLLQSVANKAFNPQDRFPLSSTPDGSAITVRVNGTLSTGWRYDSATNSIVFSSLPPAGATIEVRYRIACP